MTVMIIICFTEDESGDHFQILLMEPNTTAVRIFGRVHDIITNPEFVQVCMCKAVLHLQLADCMQKTSGLISLWTDVITRDKPPGVPASVYTAASWLHSLASPLTKCTST